jgi:hypothetical protein
VRESKEIYAIRLIVARQHCPELLIEMGKVSEWMKSAEIDVHRVSISGSNAAWAKKQYADTEQAFKEDRVAACNSVYTLFGSPGFFGSEIVKPR